MAVSLEGLDADFRAQVLDLLEDLRRSGIVMRANQSLRTPAEQAKLWRQSRSTEEIASAEQRLRDAGAHFLADTLQSVGPQHGAHVTNSLPGCSWHQWGEAVDCFWAVNGRAVWDENVLIDGVNGYRIYAERAERRGLFAGGHWRKFKDWPHVQKRAAGSPIGAGLSLQDIDETMRHRFG